MSVAVIVPTYNEANNIKKLIEEILKRLRKDDKVIIVDDNSPDGTAKAAKSLSKNLKNLYVIKRKGKGGRGSAVFEGFKMAKGFKCDYYIEMDADFSHKPEDITRLIYSIKKNKDIIIGSRYLKGSKIIGWPSQRKIFSKLANIYAKAILSVPISDYTNGFRIYSKRAVDFLLERELISTGYILLSETAYLLYKAKYVFDEIPIEFINRERGQSNTNLSEIKNAFWGVFKIRLKNKNLFRARKPRPSV